MKKIFEIHTTANFNAAPWQSAELVQWLNAQLAEIARIPQNEALEKGLHINGPKVYVAVEVFT